MSTPFDTWWAFCQRPENDGQPLHTTPDDPGGATAYGITLNTYKAWCIQHGTHTLMSAGDLGRMTLDEASQIAHTWYWNSCRCDSLFAIVSIVVCDAAWVSGPGTAIRWLQQAIGLPPGQCDGIFGPWTLAAYYANKDAAGITAEKFTDIRNNADSQMSGSAKFNRGWTRRTNDCLQVALTYKP